MILVCASPSIPLPGCSLCSDLAEIPAKQCCTLPKKVLLIESCIMYSMRFANLTYHRAEITVNAHPPLQDHTRRVYLLTISFFLLRRGHHLVT